jgi:hypothetical protein
VGRGTRFPLCRRQQKLGAAVCKLFELLHEVSDQLETVEYTLASSPTEEERW